MVSYRKVELPGGGVIDIKAPGVTYADLVPEGELTVEKGSPSCQGADIMHKGRLMKSVLQLLSAEVRVEEVNLEAETKSHGKIWRRDSGTLLNCAVSELACSVREGVLIWSLPEPACPYELVRSISATMDGGVL